MLPVRSAAIALFTALLFLLSACQRPAVSVASQWRTWVLPAEGATLPAARSIGVGPKDEFAVLDTAGRVLLYDAQGTFVRRWHMLDASVGKPEGIIILNDGTVVVCDTHYNRIVFFDPSGHWLHHFGEKGKGPGQFIYPVGIAKDSKENLYVCEYGGNDRIQVFDRSGKWLRTFGAFGTGPGEFQRPSGMAWLDGKLYVADAINNRVLIFQDSGTYLGLLGPKDAPVSFELPYDISLGPDRLFYVIEYGAGRITAISPEGKVHGRLGSTGGGESEFSTPWGIAVDSRGWIRVADTRNRRMISLRWEVPVKREE